MSTQDWRNRAACRDEDAELFFAPSDAAYHHPQNEAAKRVCGRCPVRDLCLDEALRTPTTTYGVWGGTTYEERMDIVRRTRRGQRASTVDEVAVERALRSPQGARSLPDRDKDSLIALLLRQGVSPGSVASRLSAGGDRVARVARSLDGDRA